MLVRTYYGNALLGGDMRLNAGARDPGGYAQWPDAITNGDGGGGGGFIRKDVVNGLDRV